MGPRCSVYSKSIRSHALPKHKDFASVLLTPLTSLFESILTTLRLLESSELPTAVLARHLKRNYNLFNTPTTRGKSAHTKDFDSCFTFKSYELKRSWFLYNYNIASKWDPPFRK